MRINQIPPQMSHCKMSVTFDESRLQAHSVPGNLNIGKGIKCIAISVFVIDVFLMSSLAVIIPICLWIFDWPYSIIFAPLFIYHAVFYLVFTPIILFIITTVLPIFITITILLLIMAGFTWIFGHNYQYFIDAIFAIFQVIKTQIIIILTFIFELFVWTRYKTLFLDVMFVVGQMTSAINLIVVFIKYQLKSGDIFDDRYNVPNKLNNVLINDDVLIYYLIVPYIIFAFLIFISRAILNRSRHSGKQLNISSKPEPLLFLTLIKSSNKMQKISATSISENGHSDIANGHSDNQRVEMVKDQQILRTQATDELGQDCTANNETANNETDKQEPTISTLILTQDNDEKQIIFEEDLASGWMVLYDEIGTPYYHHVEKDITQWEKPQKNEN